MSATEPGSTEELRFAELQRVNAELAAELRSLTLERTGSPRRDSLPASREVAKLRGERDALEAALDRVQTEREATAAELEHVSAHQAGLEAQNQELAREVVRLREGVGGLLRRFRARLISRGGGA